MGCDIHCYIEYRTKILLSKYDEQWRGFGGRINPGRHYGIFAKLANVRNGFGIVPISKPRGLPEFTSYELRGDSRLWISDDNASGEGNCSQENARRWIESGASKLVDEKWVTHPDWHSHSWCNADEIEEALKDPNVEAMREVEYVAIVAVLRSFEQQGYLARLVFWFDN